VAWLARRGYTGRGGGRSLDLSVRSQTTRERILVRTRAQAQPRLAVITSSVAASGRCAHRSWRLTVVWQACDPNLSFVCSRSLAQCLVLGQCGALCSVAATGSRYSACRSPAVRGFSHSRLMREKEQKLRDYAALAARSQGILPASRRMRARYRFAAVRALRRPGCATRFGACRGSCSISARHRSPAH